MKARLKKDLKADLRILRNVLRDVSAATAEGTNELNEIVEKLNHLTLQALEALSPEAQRARTFIKKNTPNLRT